MMDQTPQCRLTGESQVVDFLFIAAMLLGQLVPIVLNAVHNHKSIGRVQCTTLSLYITTTKPFSLLPLQTKFNVLRKWNCFFTNQLNNEMSVRALQAYF